MSGSGDGPGAPSAALQAARAAVESARAAQVPWGALDVHARAGRMRALRRTLMRRMDEVVETVLVETGKPRSEALLHEVLVAANLIRSFERMAPRVLATRRKWPRFLKNKRGWAIYEPFGVVAVIGPWNFPFSLLAIPAISALFAGNAVVVKPSELTPRSGALLETLMDEAMPEYPGLLTTLQGGAEVGAALVQSGVDKVAFIGGSETGKAVLRLAAETLTPVVLELGASDVAIVCDDADVERAAAGVIWGAMANAGQICVSTERVLVADAVYERFIGAARAEVERLRTGGQAEFEIGRLMAPHQLGAVRRAVEAACQRGSRVVVGGRVLDEESGLFAPTLLRDTPASDPLATGDSETFGPILPVVRVRDDAEALRVANAGPYGLSATVWTSSPQRARRLAAALEVGSVIVNDSLTSFGIPELPYGGVKASGYGRLLGEDGLREFARAKALTESRFLAGREMLWFPYSARKYRFFRRLARLIFMPGVLARLKG
jgi:acyl-CoA reductase-like NAD-dependent aldehyde dehydrogenase